MNEGHDPIVQAPEQLRYARLLDWGTHLGLVVLVLTFAAYVAGLTLLGWDFLRRLGEACLWNLQGRG